MKKRSLMLLAIIASFVSVPALAQTSPSQKSKRDRPPVTDTTKKKPAPVIVPKAEPKGKTSDTLLSPKKKKKG